MKGGFKQGNLRQFVKYALVSGLASVVEFGTFALLNFLVFAPQKSIPFHWWILHYGIDGGGLGGFLATALSYAAAQAFNFFAQRKKTFHATNNVAASFAMYAVMVVAVWLFQVWFCGVLMRAFRAPLGQVAGDLLAKCLNMTLSFLIQYPINKFVIMRSRKPRT